MKMEKCRHRIGWRDTLRTVFSAFDNEIMVVTCEKCHQNIKVDAKRTRRASLVIYLLWAILNGLNTYFLLGRINGSFQRILCFGIVPLLAIFGAQMLFFRYFGKFRDIQSDVKRDPKW